MSSVVAGAVWRVKLMVSVLALASMTSGCFYRPTFTPSGLQLSRLDSNALCKGLPTLEEQGPHSFRALLETSLNTPDNESFSFRYAVASKQPKYLRVDLLPTEGAYTLGLLVVQNDQAIVVDSQARTYSSGCEAHALFEKFFALQGVSPALVQALITGRISRLSCEAVQAYSEDSGRILLVDARTRHAWQLEQHSGRVLQVTLLDSSLQRIEARAERRYLPDEERINVEIYKPVTASAVMKVRKLTLNPEISDSLFQISPPIGYVDEGC